MGRRITFSIIVLAALLAMSCHSRADTSESKQVLEEYELDLGPQGKDRNREIYGFGTFDSNDLNIEAGELGTWEFTYHAGEMGVDDGGRVFLLFNAVADWGKFQTNEPTGANYVTARSTGDVELDIHFNRRHAGPRPYWGGLVITVGEGDLVKGDEVTITLGDRSWGGPGSRAPTITPHLASEFRFMVDPLNSVLPVRLLDSPRIRIVSSAPAKLEVLWPSERAANEETWLLVKVKDKWGNPSTSYTGTIEIEADDGLQGLPGTYAFTERDAGYHRFEGVRSSQPGEYRVTVRDVEQAGLLARSNLMVTRSTLELRHYCGDLHGQHIRGSANLNQYASYAYGFAGIDFMSWAVNDFHITKETWDGIQDTSAKFNLPGRFVAFPGYEWSATTGRGGDHNVIYLEEGQITGLTPYRLDYPTEVLRQEGEGLVVFDSMTAGDEDGVILDIATSEHSVLNFEASYRSRSQFGSAAVRNEQIKFSIPLSQLTFDDKVYPLKGVDREIVLRKVATKYPARVQFSWVEETVVPGETAAYWVRVQQEDGATAWSSPIFVNH